MSSFSPTSFYRYPDLPPELRRWVIHLSIEPRTVRLRWNSHLQHCITPDNPAITQVSREARLEALQVLRPCFDTSLESRTTILFDHAFDTVSIDWKSFAEGESSPGIITGEFPIRNEADNIISLQIHCDELRTYMIETMSQSRGYLKNLQRLHVVGCQERYSRLVPPSLLEEPFNIVAPGAITWPELTCDLNHDGRFCCLHYWFTEWNLVRFCQEKEWAIAFSRPHNVALRGHQSRVASRRFRQRRQQKLDALRAAPNQNDGERA